MANDGIVQISPDSTGKKIDTTERVVGVNTVERQRMVIGGNDNDNFVNPTDHGEMPVQVTDVMVALLAAIERLNTPMWIDPATGRLRITLDNIAGSLTLGTVTTCATVTTVTGVTNIGGISAAPLIMDNMMNNYATAVRPRIT